MLHLGQLEPRAATFEILSPVFIVPTPFSILYGSTNGRFTIHGQMRGDQLEMTLHLEEVPGISATMTSQAGTRTTTIAFDSTYQHELKELFRNAHL